MVCIGTWYPVRIQMYIMHVWQEKTKLITRKKNARLLLNKLDLQHVYYIILCVPVWSFSAVGE